MGIFYLQNFDLFAVFRCHCCCCVEASLVTGSCFVNLFVTHAQFEEASGRTKPPGVYPGGNGSLCSSFASLSMLLVDKLFRRVASLHRCCCSVQICFERWFFVHVCCCRSCSCHILMCVLFGSTPFLYGYLMLYMYFRVVWISVYFMSFFSSGCIFVLFGGISFSFHIF
jgi:hypothetical protein